MPNLTAASLKSSVRSTGFLDVLQMSSGVALIAFMWSHMILVASVNLGAGVMNAIARFLEDTHLAQTGGPLVALMFLVHFVLAARKLPFRMDEQMSIWTHSRRFQHLDTWLWMIQAASAMIILIMGSVHIWTVLTDLPITAAKSAARVQKGSWLIFYVLLLPLIELHVGIGFYRIGVKWGWISRSTRSHWKRMENRITVAFVIIGLITLFTFYRLR
jgi:fumarate reductase subunit C